MVRGPGFLLDRVRDPGTTMRCRCHQGNIGFFFSLCFKSARAALDSRPVPRLCRPAGGVERNPDPILASSRGTLKQIALDGESASRTCFRMPLAVRTPIRFGATEGGVGGIQLRGRAMPLYGSSRSRFWFVGCGSGCALQLEEFLQEAGQLSAEEQLPVLQGFQTVLLP
ncbi:hypothetical protein ERJ75_000886900 [Trypanosoma vivax]|nr:hypothetical protein ERJ75_000886900 [Trypanosoma vivax]